MITTTRIHERAVIEAEAAITALDAAITDTTEQLVVARGEAGRLDQEWNDLGTEMTEERAVAVDPFVGNENAHRARERFHQAADRRIGLDEPRRLAAGRVVDATKRLEFLRRQCGAWMERLEALRAGSIVPGEFDGAGGGTGWPGESAGEGEVTGEADASPGPADRQRVSSAVSTVPEGAPTAASARTRPWWVWS